MFFYLKKIKLNSKGFTLLESIVALSLFVIIILITSSFYTLSQRTYNKGSDTNELVQNARVVMDRITREIRQSVDMVTVLPPTDTDINNPPTSEIFFQNGHDIDNITYIKYYLDGTDLKRDVLAYYFDIEPTSYVLYNSVNAIGDPPSEMTIESRVVGEYFTNIDFWGVDNLVHIYLELKKQNNFFQLRSASYSRN